MNKHILGAMGSPFVADPETAEETKKLVQSRQEQALEQIALLKTIWTYAK